MSSGTHQLSGRSRLFLLAALTTLSPFATDTVVPGLDAIAAGLDVTQAQAQQTLSTYMFGVALMALFHGAISDAVGRRPVVLVGLALFSVAALGCALAGDIQMLIVLRFIQGLAGGAGMIVVRAMVRDALDGPPAQRLLSQVMFVFAVAPAIAPIIGGFAVAEFG